MDPIKLTYAGRKLSTGNTFSYLFFDESGESLSFKKKILSFMTIGRKIECVPEGDGVYSGWKETDEIAGQHFIDKHVARDRAVYELHRSRKEMAKVPENAYNDLIKKLKYVTCGLSQSEKKALTIKILLEIL